MLSGAIGPYPSGDICKMVSLAATFWKASTTGGAHLFFIIYTYTEVAQMKKSVNFLFIGYF